jgi:hypothetical protein
MERGWKRRPRFSYAPCIDLWQPRGEGGPEHYQKKGFHLSGHVACESAHYHRGASRPSGPHPSDCLLNARLPRKFQVDP